MEYIIPILILFILLNTLLKISFWRWWQAAIFSALTAEFVLLVVPVASEQSKIELASWLQNRTIMQNVAILTTIETVILFAFAFMRLNTQTKRYVMLLLELYPGLLILPILFYLSAQLFFALPGVAFGTVGYALAGAVLVALPLFSWGLSKLVPEDELRLEVQFIVNIFVCIIGLIATVNGNTTYRPVEQPLDFRSLAIILIVFVAMFAGGFLFNKYKRRKI